jgi:hypothetical protein
VGKIEWVSFVCVDRLATDGLYAIRHGCYILVGPLARSDEFSRYRLTHGSILTHRTDEEEGGQREKKERNEYRVHI